MISNRDLPMNASRSQFRLRPEILALLAWGLSLAAIALVGFYKSGGHFFFSLDDPYIHLAVGKSILQGGYGINVSEYSSPSSSIIWPYLMAFTEAIGLAAYGPFLISVLAAGATIWLMVAILVRERIIDAGTPLWAQAAAVLFCILITNAIALPLTGMEHNLHIFATLVVFSGLLNVSRGGDAGSGTIVAIICLPLIRFEGIAFAAAAIIVLVLLGQRRAALVASLCICLAIGAYVASMVSRGLPILPSSVLMKSTIAASAYGSHNPLGRIVGNIKHALIDREGRVLVLTTAILIVLIAAIRPALNRTLVYAAVLLASFAHFLVGTYGWFYRYEVYIVALVGFSCLVILFSDGKDNVAKTPNARFAFRCAVIVLLAFACRPYVYAIIQTPHAMLVTYTQQAQMARFAQQFYRKPVAVNDLGLVSYGNPSFVLDLWGLGSEEVRQAKLAGRFGPAEMDAAVLHHGIDLAMIYEQWFSGKVPPNWTRVAVLHTPVGLSSVGDVSIYATNPAATDGIRSELHAFASTLPKDDSLSFD